MTGMPNAVRKCTRIMWPGKVLEKAPRGVIPLVCVKYRKNASIKEKRKTELGHLLAVSIVK
jgi:hypothetical protein